MPDSNRRGGGGAVVPRHHGTLARIGRRILGYLTMEAAMDLVAPGVGLLIGLTFEVGRDL